MEEYLRKLVAYKTVVGNTRAIDDSLDWLEAYFSDHYMYTHRIAHNGVGSLIATTKPTRKPRVLLQAHLDVVAAKDTQFKLILDGDKLIARGAYDMKFAIAVFMELVADMQSIIGDYDFGIMITSDEEDGGHNGVKYLLDDGWSAGVCILPDGGDNWQLEETAKGFWLLEAIAHGKAAHGSRPWDGDNAIDRLLGFIRETEKPFAKQTATTPTLAVTTINGGTAVNQIPDIARASLDIRTTKTGNHHEIMAAIRNNAAKYRVEVERVFGGEPHTTNVKDKTVQSFLEITSQVRKESLGLSKSLGASDGRFFASHDITTLIMRPRGGGAHGPDEWVNKTDLPVFKRILREFLNKHATYAVDKSATN